MEILKNVQTLAQIMFEQKEKIFVIISVISLLLAIFNSIIKIKKHTKKITKKKDN